MTVGHALKNLSKNFMNECEKPRHTMSGIAQTAVVLGRTQVESCATVTPVGILIINFAGQSVLIPFLLRMYASCGS